MSVTTDQISQAPLASTGTPRVWVLVGEKPGDNQQVELIGETLRRRLAWPVEVRRLRFRRAVGKQWKFRPDVAHVEWSQSDPVLPPWPDLVITIGRLPSMVALWAKQQSGGATKLVIVGRPRRWLHRFDLIIVAAHHHAPPLPNVIRLGLPLISVDRVQIDEAHARWAPQFATMRRPLFALFVGGQAKPHILNRAVALDLMDRTRQCVEEAGGSVWVATSPRTSSTVVDALVDSLPTDGRIFRWSANATDNPYLGLLGGADRFIVTGDSVSMQVAVARTGKPLAIYPLPARYGTTERLRRLAASIAYGREPQIRVLPGVIQKMQSLGLVKFPRDVDRVHALLVERGLAVRLGGPFRPAASESNVELDQIVDRIRDIAINAGRTRSSM